MGRRLNLSTPTVINTELAPLDDSFYIANVGLLEQWYYDNTQTYSPNRAITPLTLSPVFKAVDKETQETYTPTAYSVRWYENAYYPQLTTTYTYAISAYSKGETTDTPPADVTTWSSSKVQPTTAKPFSWVRRQQVTGSTTLNTIYFVSDETWNNSSADGYAEKEITTQVDSGSAEYVIADGTLRVKKNVSYSRSVTIRCVAQYIDPRDEGITYTVEDSVILTTNRDADVVFAEVAITSPSARSFNPLTSYKTVDGATVQDSEFDFDAVVTNAPPITDIGNTKYKMDGWGTEQILPDNDDALVTCAPELTIEYPDGSVESDAQFFFRPTANGEKLGSTVSYTWNQLVQNGDFSNGTTGWSGSGFIAAADGLELESGASADQDFPDYNPSHRYYLAAEGFGANAVLMVSVTAGTHSHSAGLISINRKNVSTRDSTIVEGECEDAFLDIASLAGDSTVKYVMLVDLTMMYGAGNEPSSAEAFEADFERIFGRTLEYEPYNTGETVTVSVPFSGTASISRVKGNTVVWNQLVQNGDFASGTTMWTTYNCSASVSGGEVTIEKINTNSGGMCLQRITVDVSHKYYMACDAKMSVGSDFVNLGFHTSSHMIGGNAIVNTSSTSYTRLRQISSPINSSDLYTIRVGSGASASGTTGVVKNAVLIDLTLIYGAGNEPSTVEEFEADFEEWFGHPLSYEEYNAGELIPVKSTSVKTNGFNQWDEEWEGGSYYTGTGQKTTRNDAIRCKNLIPVLPNTTYYFHCGSHSTTGEGVWFWYDKEEKFIKNVISRMNRTETSPSNAAYLAFYIAPETTYNNDVCINLAHDNSRNGEYESYWDSIAKMDVTKVKGKLNGSGSDVVVFPDGMKRVGDVYDEIVVEDGVLKAYKRVGSVDLGTLTWEKRNNSYNCYQVRNTFPYKNKKDPNILLTKYTYGGSLFLGDQIFNTEDKTLYVYFGEVYGSKYVYVHDESYTTADAFQTAMSGEILYYEMDTPEVYILNPMQDFGNFVWYGIDENRQEVLVETLPWYKSGQYTDKLTVDAMYGESINVVLRARANAFTDALSPSKAYASVEWRIPDVDTHVVSENGSAVRGNTTEMTFGTICNTCGQVLSDAVKNEHLRFNWKYRYNNLTTEVDQGWGAKKTIAASALRHVKGSSSTLASTLVFPYPYCLGAWKVKTTTDTVAYDRPEKTVNGVTYVRTID